MKILDLTLIFVVYISIFNVELINGDCDEVIIPNVCPFPLNGTVKNVAISAPAAQSTQYLWGGEPKLAVDGNRNQLFWVGLSCSHTAEHRVENEKYPWLRLDLGRPHLVRSVELYSRADPCCADRYHDIQIRVGNYLESGLGYRFNKNGLCSELIGGGYAPGTIFNFTCVPCLAGRYLSVQIVRNCPKCQLPDYNILSICELVVNGYPV